MNNESRYPLKFYPEGSIFIDGPEKYRSVLKSQNEYLHNMSTFPMNNTSRQQMSLIRQKLEEHPSIKLIIPTNKTDTTGRWLIESTKKYVKQAKAHVENILMQLDGDLRENLENNGYEVMPNISLTSWGANDISDLIETTEIKHPDKEQNNPKPNAWIRPPRTTRPVPMHTYETLPTKKTPVPITPNRYKTNLNTTPKETQIDSKKLMEEIQSLKNEVLNQCKSYIEQEIKK